MKLNLSAEKLEPVDYLSKRYFPELQHVLKPHFNAGEIKKLAKVLKENGFVVYKKLI